MHFPREHHQRPVAGHTTENSPDGSLDTDEAERHRRLRRVPVDTHHQRIVENPGPNEPGADRGHADAERAALRSQGA